MAQTFYKIWIHLVWTTKNRTPLMRKPIRPMIFQHIIEKAQTEGFHLDMINGIENHVHCLLSLNPKYAISQVVNLLKGESSHWINLNKIIRTRFSWQDGFSAFSVSESQVQRLRNYILNQEKHHRRMSYEEEIQKLYKLHKIELPPNEGVERA